VVWISVAMTGARPMTPVVTAIACAAIRMTSSLNEDAFKCAVRMAANDRASCRDISTNQRAHAQNVDAVPQEAFVADLLEVAVCLPRIPLSSAAYVLCPTQSPARGN
jgi:hypothetical protein